MIKEEKINISTDINIGATIAYQNKEEKKPLVLLIMGSGSLDRDGNTFGFKTNLYKDLSDMFVDMGYVCVRYDKRGTHKSTGDAKTSGLSDLVNDAANVINYAKKIDYVDENKIVVCGHSEGAMIATLLTKKSDLDLNGLILLSGACTSLKDAMLYQNYLVLEQVKNMKGILGWYLRKVINEEKIDKQVNELFERAEKSTKPRYFYNGMFFSTKYMKEHNDLAKKDYINILKEFKGKVLAITGKKDVQANYNDLEAIRFLDNVTIYEPEDINHILREVESENNIMNIKKEYKFLFKKPISKKINNSIKNWINNI